MSSPTCFAFQSRSTATVDVGPSQAEYLAAAHPGHRRQPQRCAESMFGDNVEELSELVFVPAALLRCGAVTGRVHQAGDVAVHEPGSFGVAERGAKDLMHVQHGLRCERAAVMAATATQVAVEVLEMGDGEAAEWHSTDVREHVAVDHILVSECGRGPKTVLASRQPASAEVTRHGDAT